MWTELSSPSVTADPGTICGLVGEKEVCGGVRRWRAELGGELEGGRLMLTECAILSWLTPVTHWTHTCYHSNGRTGSPLSLLCRYVVPPSWPGKW